MKVLGIDVGGTSTNILDSGQKEPRRFPSGPDMDPKMGRLLPFYEHNVFTQGTVWRIDSFDQRGMELGKILAKRIIPVLDSEDAPKLTHDSSTNQLIRRYRAMRSN